MNASNTASQSAAASSDAKLIQRGEFSSLALCAVRENFILSGFGQQKDVQFGVAVKMEFYHSVISWLLSYRLCDLIQY